MDFSTLSPALSTAIAKAGFSEPTSFQKNALPFLLQERNLLLEAPTGSGKTLAFLIAAFELVLREKSPPLPSGESRLCVLLLAPTRDLARQVAEMARAVGRYLGVSCGVVSGGMQSGRIDETLSKNPVILVATPGKTEELFHTGQVDPDFFRLVILDEADRLFDQEFFPQIQNILNQIPHARFILSSATFSEKVLDLTRKWMKNLRLLRENNRDNPQTLPPIRQRGVFVREAEKQTFLKTLVEQCLLPPRTLIFVNKRGQTETLTEMINRLKLPGRKAAALHGGYSLPERKKRLREFQNGETGFLVVTDVAARGIDVTDVALVLNYDAPNTQDIYTHRIGRSGRIRKKGDALTFFTPEQRLLVRAFEAGHSSRIRLIPEETLFGGKRI